MHEFRPVTGPITGLRYAVGLCLLWLVTVILTQEQGGHIVDLCIKKVLERHPDTPELFARTYLRQ